MYLFSDTERSSPLIKAYHACNITMYLFSDTERSSSLINGYHACNITMYLFSDTDLQTMFKGRYCNVPV